MAVSSLQAIMLPRVTCWGDLPPSRAETQDQSGQHVKLSYRVTAKATQEWHGGPWTQVPPGGTVSHGTLWGESGKEDVHLGQEGSDRALPPQLHLYIQGKVPWLQDRPLQGHHASVGIESACDKVALFITLGDGQGDGVPGKGGSRADAEDMRRYQQACLEIELVVCDASWRGLTLRDILACGALTLPVRGGCLVSGWGPSLTSQIGGRPQKLAKEAAELGAKFKLYPEESSSH